MHIVAELWRARAAHARRIAEAPLLPEAVVREIRDYAKECEDRAVETDVPNFYRAEGLEPATCCQ